MAVFVRAAIEPDTDIRTRESWELEDLLVKLYRL